VTERLRETEVLTAALDKRLAELKMAFEVSRRQTIDAEHLRETLKQFDRIWDVLHAAERVELMQQLVDTFTYNADDDTVAVTFHHTAPEHPQRLRTRKRHYESNHRSADAQRWPIELS